MTPNPKALGLLLAALLALGAMGASGASAAESLFHSHNEKTNITGEQLETQVLTVAGLTITCATAKFAGTQNGQTTDELTIDTAYTGCTVHVPPFQLSTALNMNSCDYVFHANGAVDVECAEAEDAITWEVSNFLGKCLIEIGEQTGLDGVTYDGTETGSNDVTLTTDVKGIHGFATGNLCPVQGTFSDGAYSGDMAWTGFADPSDHGPEDAVDIWVTHR